MRRIRFYESATITTSLSKALIIEKLNKATQPVKAISLNFGGNFDDSQKQFQGKIGENSFTISRLTIIRNSFEPKITGYIKEQGGLTIVRINMRLFKPVVIFYVVSLVASTFFFLIARAFEALMPSVKIVGFAPFIFLVLFGIVGFIAFKVGCKKSTEILSQLLRD